MASAMVRLSACQHGILYRKLSLCPFLALNHERYVRAEDNGFSDNGLQAGHHYMLKFGVNENDHSVVKTPFCHVGERVYN